jgi:hypothetical protein
MAMELLGNCDMIGAAEVHGPFLPSDLRWRSSGAAAKLIETLRFLVRLIKSAEGTTF